MNTSTNTAPSSQQNVNVSSSMPEGYLKLRHNLWKDPNLKGPHVKLCLIFMLGKTPTWKFKNREIASAVNCCADTVEKSITKLRMAGYCLRYQVKDRSRFAGWVLKVADAPIWFDHDDNVLLRRQSHVVYVNPPQVSQDTVSLHTACPSHSEQETTNYSASGPVVVSPSPSDQGLADSTGLFDELKDCDGSPAPDALPVDTSEYPKDVQNFVAQWNEVYRLAKRVPFRWTDEELDLIQPLLEHENRTRKPAEVILLLASIWTRKLEGNGGMEPYWASVKYGNSPSKLLHVPQDKTEPMIEWIKSELGWTYSAKELDRARAILIRLKNEQKRRLDVAAKS